MGGGGHVNSSSRLVERTERTNSITRQCTGPVCIYISGFICGRNKFLPLLTL